MFLKYIVTLPQQHGSKINYPFVDRAPEEFRGCRLSTFFSHFSGVKAVKDKTMEIKNYAAF